MQPQELPLPRRFCSMADVMCRARPVGAPPPVARARVAAVYDAVVCDACGSGDREGKQLLCDGCDRGRHTFCLSPVAAVEVPDGPWFCGPTCAPPVSRPVESGMDEGDEPERASSSSKKDNTSVPNSKIKPIGPTLFSKDSINSSTFRGFHLPNIFKTPNLDLLEENTITTQNKESELTLDVRTPKTRPISVDKNQCASASIDFESAQKVMQGVTKLSLPILCGEVSHPDVDKFIKSTITGVGNEEEMEKIAGACRTFFRESVQKYIQSIEPVIVNQCCDMVKSFLFRLQQTRGDNTLNGPSIINPSSEHEKNKAHDSNAFCGFEHSEQSEQGAPALNNSCPNVELCEKPMKCLTWDSYMVLRKVHTCSFPDQSKTTPGFRSSVSRMIADVIEDIRSSNAGITDEQAKASITLNEGNGSDGILKKRDTPVALNSLVSFDKKEEDSLNLSASTHNGEIVFGTNFAPIIERAVHNKEIVGKIFANAHDLPATPCDGEKLIPSCSKAKRNFMLNDDGTIFDPDSPQKKIKFPRQITAKFDGGSDTSWKAQCEPSCSQKSDGGPRVSNEPCANTTNSSNDVKSPNATPNMVAKDGMKSKEAKHNLSDLGHKKHAMKEAPGPLFNGGKIQGQKP